MSGTLMKLSKRHQNFHAILVSHNKKNRENSFSTDKSKGVFLKDASNK